MVDFLPGLFLFVWRRVFVFVIWTLWDISGSFACKQSSRNVSCQMGLCINCDTSNFDGFQSPTGPTVLKVAQNSETTMWIFRLKQATCYQQLLTVNHPWSTVIYNYLIMSHPWTIQEPIGFLELLGSKIHDDLSTFTSSIFLLPQGPTTVSPSPPPVPRFLYRLSRSRFGKGGSTAVRPCEG